MESKADEPDGTVTASVSESIRTKLRRRRRWRKVSSVLLTLLVLLLMKNTLVRHMLYPAPSWQVPSPPPAPLREARLTVDGKEIRGWTAGGDDDAGGPAVLYLYGNGENLATLELAGQFARLAELGGPFLVVDYPGYGGSQGKPSEKSLVAAGEAGLAWLVERYPERPRIVIGWSLGAAVAIQVASRAQASLDALVLLSAWDDLPTLAKVHFPSWLVRWGLGDRYDSRAAARQLRLPGLMIHGTADAVIPIEHGRRLAVAWSAAPRFVEVDATGHNDLLDRPRVWRELGSFVAAVGSRSRDGVSGSRTETIP